jgi:chemosensory pili system protein ChpA (sensor histidine kinase/response regulator)
MSPPSGQHPPKPGAGLSAFEWNTAETELLRSLFLDEAQEHLRRIAEAERLLARVPQDGDGVLIDAVDALLRPLHSLKGAAGSVGFEAIGRTAHELEELCAEIRNGALAPTAGILERIDEGMATLRALIDGARAAPSTTRHDAGVVLSANGEDSGERHHAPDGPKAIDRRQPERSVRVESGRLDPLLDGIGDLVILRTRIERRLRELESVLRDMNRTRTSLRTLSSGLGEQWTAVGASAETAPDASQAGNALDRLSDAELELSGVVAHLDRATRGLGAEAEALRRTTGELDEALRRARLVPLDWAFQRLPPALRELERTAGRHVELVIRGGEIEVDKSLVEQIADPLLHLLRNALAHGIEAPGDRQARGKSTKGRIQVTARQEGEFVFIRFDDDGRGINREEIRQALVRRGRIPADAPLDERTLLSAIFEPGFSSRAEADALAGRGMGLNIVKRAVTRLGGDVSVQYRSGAGTRFRVAVPMHAAITQALLFKVGGQVYAVPAAHVVQALPLGPDALLVKDGAVEGVALRRASADAHVPILRLQSLLGLETAPGRRTAALHIRYGERGFIATCDKIIGLRTIVVRPLGPLLGTLPLYAGVTISGAGKAQLVLDLGALAEAAYAQGRHLSSGVRRSQPRVLVVDDSRLAREATAAVLVGAGFQAVTAEDGWEAWELLGERRFDAVVTDLEMPRVDGFELIARIRREATLRRLPIVVLSSRTAQPTRARALSVGANLILPKGPHKKALTEAVASLLESHEGAEQRARGGKTDG